jgi:hypothetical protein
MRLRNESKASASSKRSASSAFSSYCPCCGYRVRNGPRSFKFKAELRIKQKQKEMQMQRVIILYCMHNSSLELKSSNDLKKDFVQTYTTSSILLLSLILSNVQIP